MVMGWITVFILIKAGLAILGGVFELGGVVLMSGRYVNVETILAIQALVSSLWRGETARKVANIEAITVEDVMSSLQGLCLIAIGFILSTASNIMSAF